MRFLTLGLARYGAFTDRTLVFRRDARLHLVFGPNEAGKTTALSAIGDLLYGIHKDTPFGFKHKYADLLIEAEIVSAAGETLAFQRRKRLKGALTRADGAALGNDALEPFTGGLERAHFEMSFGLTAQRLRLGADQLLEQDARDGAALFAASSGLHGLTALIGRLDAEAASLRGLRSDADRPVNAAIRRSGEAVKALRAAEQQSSKWLELDRAIQIQRSALAALEPQSRAASRAIGQFTRLQQAHEAIASAETGLTNAKAAAADGQRKLDACPPRDAVLNHSGEIAALRNNSAYLSYVEDLPEVSEQMRQHTDALAALARAVGCDAGSLVERQPSDAGLARVKRLIGEGQKFAQQLTDLDALIRDKRMALAALAEPTARMPVDPAGFRLRLETMGDELDQTARRSELAQAIARDAAQLARRASALNPPVADVEAVARLPLPSQEVVGGYKAASAALVAEREQVRAARTKAAAAERAAAQMARDLAAGGEPVTAAQVKDARAARDALWRELARHLAGAAALGAGEVASASVELTAAIATADRLADLAAAQAGRAAKVELTRNQLAAAAADGERSARDLTQVDARIEETRTAWLREWESSGIAPKTAAEMADWLTRLESLENDVSRITASRSDLASLETRARALLPHLSALSADMGLTHQQADAGLAAAEILRRLGELAKDWEAQRDAQRDRERIDREISGCQEQRERLSGSQAVWWRAWTEALEVLGCAADASFEEAAAAREAWAKVPAALAQRDEAARRVNGMKRDIAAFEERALWLATTLDPTRGGITNAAFEAESLVKRYDAAAKAEQERANLMRVAADAASALAAAAAALLAARVGRAELASTLGYDPDTEDIALRLAGLEEEQSRLMAETSERAPVLKDLEATRQAMEESLAAERAMAEVKDAEVEAQSLARDWVVAKLAGRMVAEAVKRQRGAAEGRLLGAAGAHFRTLTGGRFAGLEMMFGETETASLTARRADGEVIAVARLKDQAAEAVSEGTRDQVYLALRLAFLEDYASRAEPLPFIGDDIFVSFDDERTGHALEALAGIADRLQPIVFTHHRAVIDIARARLGDAVDVIEL